MTTPPDGGASPDPFVPERNAGYDDWLDAIAAGRGYFLTCPDGHGSLPPRRICPQCGDRDLTEHELSDEGTIVTVTTVRVATPAFTDDVPYVTGIADFGPVRLTGVVRGASPDAVSIGQSVTPTVETTETTGDPLLVLRVT